MTECNNCERITPYEICNCGYYKQDILPRKDKTKNFILFTIVIILFTIPLLFSCTSNIKKDNKVDNYLKGNHKLRKLNANEQIIQTPFSASYFLFFASATGGGEEKVQYIAFSWLDNQDEYVLSKVMMQDVRVKFHKDLKEPYVTFRNDYTDGGSYYTQEDIINSSARLSAVITNVTVHCAEEDYPKNININQIE